MNRVALHVRLWRLARFLRHGVRGWWLSRFHFGKGDAAKENEALRRWSRELLRLLGIRVEVHGLPAQWPRHCVVVANHISWLDIFLIYTEAPGLFVAKSDIRAWPLIGPLIERVGTLFITRGSPRHARQMNAEVAEALARGRRVCLFPEGTTSEGREVLRFHAALLQPAIASGAVVLPAALRYTECDGRFCAAPNYTGETTLAQSLWRIVSHRGLRAELRFLSPLDAAEAERRSLAQAARAAIAASVQTGSRSPLQCPPDL